MSLKMIGAPSRRVLPNGGEAREANYLYIGPDPSDPASGVPYYGDSATFMEPKTVNGLSLPAKVTDRRADYIGGGAEGTASAHWSVYVTAAHEDAPEIQVPASPDRMERQVRSDYQRKVVFLDPAWWGITAADRRVAGLDPIRTTTSGDKDTEWFLNVQNIDGDRAREGDFIFKNTGFGGLLKREIDKSTDPPTWGKVTVSKAAAQESDGTGLPVKGQADTRLSPYGTGDYGPTDANVAMAGTKAIVLVYTVTYFERGDDYGPFAAWSGVSPGGGAAFARRCAPRVSANVPAFWLATDNRFAPATDTLGDRWVQITRVVESAPPGWRWNAEKSINGTWSW